ncbi:MAG: carotenoid oxygenase family protein, partial [Microthrixaceae bacterium]
MAASTDHVSAAPSDGGSLYLSGSFGPVSEEVTAFDLPVSGELPAELSGRYLRNGPNPLGTVDPATHHWFLGDGMVHGIRLDEGRAAWYRNRYVGSKRVSAARGEPDIAGPNWNGADIAPNTAVGGWAGTTWALVEAGVVPVELGYELETIARNDFGGTITGPFSAHPKYDPVTRELHAMAYALPEWLDHIAYVVIGADGLATKELEIPIAGMPMVHDMSITRTWVLIYDQPVTVDIELAMVSPFPFRWNPDHGRRVGLMPREGTPGEIVWIDLPLGYAYHPLNAYDTDDGKVVVDICTYDRMFDRDPLGPFGDGGLGRLERWELDPEAARVSISVIDDQPNEFPRCNEACSTT